MSDLICRKSMARCLTPGMCSPHGGCQPDKTEWQSGYDEGRRMGAKHMYAEVDRLKAELAGLRTGYEAYESVNKGLKAEVEVLSKEADLHQQIQRAAKELPFGWDITLIVEQCSGWVELTDPHGTVVELDDLPADLAVQVSMAIDVAMGKGEQA